MKLSISKFYHFGFSVLMSVATANTALADDIDLYITSTTGSSDVKPNVLFIIDSSGSMDAVDVPVDTLVCTTEDNVEITGYDPDFSYPGDYNASRIYVFDPGENSPAEGGSDVGSFLTSDSYCDAANTSIAAAGEAISHKLTAYRPKNNGTKWKWRKLQESDKSGIKVECETDAGEHGENTGDAAVYATSAQDSANEWTSVSDDRFDNWSNRVTYNLYAGNKLNYQDLVNAEDGTVTTVEGSTQTCETTTTIEERLQVVKNVANNLITTVSGINLGIMSFVEGDREGGFVRKEVVDIDATNVTTGDDHKTELTAVVNGINHSGHTPLGETLYEAARYFKGESPDFGSGHSVDESISGSNYISPITDVCQATNNIILLSDGQPYSDFNHNDGIQTYLNTDDGIDDDTIPDPSDYDCPSQSDNSSDSDPSRSCLVEVADFIAHNDLSTLDGKQTAALYTIGFANDLAVMEDAAAAGEGNYYQSNSYTELTDTLNNIIVRVLASDTTFMSPAVSVNAFNRLQHNDEIYYGMFSPDANARWNGNIKKYKINDAGEILDQNDDNAINSDTGYFKDTAQSFWSTNADGKETISGGARTARGERDTPRTIYTYTGSAAPTAAVRLNQPAHQVLDSNTELTQAMLDVTDATDRTEMINWALGYDDDGTTKTKFIGDPLHSRPTVVVYSGTSADTQDTTVFFGTNEGFLHAINGDVDDGKGGEEEFAFIPQALLPNIKDYVNDTAGTKIYGLDGEITIWKNDLNNNGVVYSGTSLESTDGVNEGVYLYIGMRRGGNKYYALDVTDRSAPKLMWRIDGGTGNFTELGQSWSKPILGKVNLNGTPTQVLFFGGGYDTDQDDAAIAEVDDIGRSLFMVDATSGALLWSAGPNSSDDLTLSDMNNSIASNVTIGDLSNDGLTDVVFTSTMGGEVWRFDINNYNTGVSDFATGGEILDINGSSSIDTRKFFAHPDVSLFAPRGEDPYFLIAIGSGTRDDPLNTTVENRFYVKKEFSPFSAPKDSDGVVSYTREVESDLYDATDNLIQSGSETQQKQAIADLGDKSGWFIELEGKDASGVAHDGEKVISGSITFGGKVIFTSYTPDFTVTDKGCELNLGIARLYVLDILNGTAAVDLDGSGDDESDGDDADDIDEDDRSLELKQTGLPAPANIVHTQATDDDGSDIEGKTKKILCVATECFDDVLSGDGELTQSYWRENN